MTATFTIAGNASSGNRTVKVSVGGAQSSSSANFYVQKPYLVVVTSVTSENLGCPTGYVGYGAKVTYQILDENSQAILRSGLTPEEYFTVNGQPGIPDWAPFATPTTTDADGKFNDIPIGTCSMANYNFCKAVEQSFRIKVPVSGGSPEILYMPTTITRKDCRDGLKLTVGNNGMTPQVTTLGTVPN